MLHEGREKEGKSPTLFYLGSGFFLLSCDENDTMLFETAN